MPRNMKKKAPEPQLCQPGEIFAALKMLESERGIPVDYMIERIKQALANAYRKDREDHREVPAENVVVELTETAMSMYLQKTVVEEVENPGAEISLDAARNRNPSAQLGETVSIPVKVESFGRIAAQTAKQVIIQGIREAERGAIYENYSTKAQELLTGTVLRIDPQSGDVFLRIGTEGDRSDAVLRAGEQIPGETFQEGQLVRVYVVDVRRANRGPQVAVSRTHPNMVRRLFELEVPEIAEGLVELRNIAREPGSRTKVAVRATQEGIDPVGACVGPKGGRVGAIVQELHNEKIDIITWSEDPAEYVAAALNPASTVSVTPMGGPKAFRVIVPDDQLSLAIGREGQNARLAARLTSCKIDIKSVSRAAAEAAEEAAVPEATETETLPSETEQTPEEVAEQ